MAQTLLFSIIIPAYNYAAVLPRAINSVLQQDGNDWELIVINDGSTDNTSEVLQSWDNKKFSYVEQKNIGLAATRNKGIKASSGNYLIFLDADDEMAEGALKNFRIAIQSQPNAALFIGGHESISSSGKSKLHLPKLKKLKKIEKLKSYL
ncbi:MAG: glycosyltransferase family 2 protein, partial [Pseudomonadales bacterium]|nr:glycosyltransferase family 2 protein [Pseudomonadales bacterium]